MRSIRLSFIFSSLLCHSFCTQAQVVSFEAPDTAYLNVPIQLVNKSSGASSYFWNFCTTNALERPVGKNLGSLNDNLNTPVYVDYVYENGNYYGFSTNNVPGKLLRLEFGSSLLNTPKVRDLGNLKKIIPNHTEGLQIVKNKGNWFVVVVGGDEKGTTEPRIVTVSLGKDIANNAPSAKNWGNLGNMSYPHDLFVFSGDNRWFGFTVNTTNNTITRFEFGDDLEVEPRAKNLGNIGKLNGPTGIYATKNGQNWYAFITNAVGNTITRLDFGTSLLSVPTGENLGNIGNLLKTPWDIYIINHCGRNLGFVINAGNNELIRLEFGDGLRGIPKSYSYGNVGNMSFPHCISKVFRAGADLYAFVMNVNNHSLSRFRFEGCTQSNINSSVLETPPPIQYNALGVYNINLMTNEGLPTQSEVCKQIVVVEKPIVLPKPKARRIDTLVIPDVLFATNSYALNPKANLLLDSFAKAAQNRQIDSLVVEGHTDSIGSRTSNQLLSENRSKTVGFYLQPFFQTKIKMRGYASERPIADNRTKEGRQKNRRVVIYLYLKE